MASPLTLVTPSPTRDRPLQLSRTDIEGLAGALLDLGSTVEHALRTVMSMQRSLERVRRCDELSPEGALLLQEMSRQIQTLTEGQEGLDERLRIAARHIASVRCDQG